MTEGPRNDESAAEVEGAIARILWFRSLPPRHRARVSYTVQKRAGLEPCCCRPMSPDLLIHWTLIDSENQGIPYEGEGDHD